jgi:DNA-directed RNA polymerase beta subunit
VGLQAVFRRVFPIKDFNESASLDFVKYEIDAPKYEVDECHSRGMTYSAPMKVSIRLIVWEKDEVTGQQSIRSFHDRRDDWLFGDEPLVVEARICSTRLAVGFDFRVEGWDYGCETALIERDGWRDPDWAPSRRIRPD